LGVVVKVQTGRRPKSEREELIAWGECLTDIVPPWFNDLQMAADFGKWPWELEQELDRPYDWDERWKIFRHASSRRFINEAKKRNG
jgi:hypothetical protein